MRCQVCSAKLSIRTMTVHKEKAQIGICPICHDVVAITIKTIAPIAVLPNTQETAVVPAAVN